MNIFERITKKITLGIWSIKVFESSNIISNSVNENNLTEPTLCAKDVTDVQAEFIADPFIICHDSIYYMYFEVLDKTTNKGLIGFATSQNGLNWNYNSIVLRENYHLSYPYVFKHNNEFYMIPESSKGNGVYLYKSMRFPFEWTKVKKIINGKYVDSSIFQYNNKWWIFTYKSGKLHLFFSDKIEGEWREHPKSPITSENYSITRPGGRVIVKEKDIFRYGQNGVPNYGSSLKVYKINKLTDEDYAEEEVSLILSGSNKELDWRKDGMHTIDHLKINDNHWLVAVDGHRLVQRNYLKWKMESMFSIYFLKKMIRKSP